MKLYYTISEVAEQLNVNASHLRFLESQFPEIRPNTNSRGVRHYRQADIDVIKRIIYLTKECGYTLEGTRQQLKANRKQQDQGQRSALEEKMEIVQDLQDIRQFLVELKEQL